MKQSDFIKVQGEAATVEEALRFGNLDAQITASPIYDQDMRQIEGHQRIGTNQQTYGITSERYNIVQNRDALGIMNDILGASSAQISTIGYDHFGARVFVQAKMPHSWEALKGDAMDNYLTISTTHNGKGSVKATFGSLRLFCQNQMSAVLKATSERMVSIRHNSKANERVREAAQIMMEGSKEWDIIKEQAEILARKSVSRKQSEAFVQAMFPAPPKDAQRDGNKTARETLSRLIDTHKGVEVSGGTAWGLFNAATEYFDHHAQTRGDNNLTVRSVLNGHKFRAKAAELAMA
jgi:phage/plasmid-like protein (TIGR03299 family)